MYNFFILSFMFKKHCCGGIGQCQMHSLTIGFDPGVFCPLAEQQYVSDILGLIEHGDPQIRGATAILCGAIIQAALTKTRYNIHSWLASVQSVTG